MKTSIGTYGAATGSESGGYREVSIQNDKSEGRDKQKQTVSRERKGLTPNTNLDGSDRSRASSSHPYSHRLLFEIRRTRKRIEERTFQHDLGRGERGSSGGESLHAREEPQTHGGDDPVVRGRALLDSED